MNGGRVLRIWAASAAVLLAAAAARAGAPAVKSLPHKPARTRDYKLTVSAGLSRYCRMGWIPVHVAIEAGKSFEGDLVAVLRSGQRGAVLFEARREVNLAAGSKKDYHFYLLHDNPHASTPQVEVYLQRGRPLSDTRQSRQLNLVSRVKYLVCVVSEKPGVLRGIIGPNRMAVISGQQKGADYSREFMVSQPGLRQLPDRAAGYNGVDFLVLCDTPFKIGKLSQPQLEAIVDYARGGGVVVLASSDRKWFAKKALSELLPRPAVTAASRSEANALVGRLRTRYGIFGLGAKGLAVHKFKAPGFRQDSLRGFSVGRCGSGTVLLWQLSPGDSAVSGWSGLYNLWADVGRQFYRSRPQEDYGSGFGVGSGDQNNPIAQARGRATNLNMAKGRAPAALLVVFLVVFYLVLVGPVNYFVLRRLDMRALSIVTIPLLSVVFVLLTFAVGYIYRGVTTVGRRVTVGLTSSGAGRATCVTSQSIFPSGSMLVEVSTDGRGLLAPLTKELSGQQQSSFTLQDESRFVLERHPMRMWEMAYFHGESVRRLGGSVRLVALPGGRYQLRNESSVQLKDAFIVSSVTGGKYSWIGEVGKGTHTGQLLPWQKSGGPRAVRPGPNKAAPLLKLQDALVLWQRGELGKGVSYSVIPREGAFSDQAARVICNDLRLRVPTVRGRSRVLLFARINEELEPVRLDGRVLRGDETIDLLVVRAERGGAK